MAQKSYEERYNAGLICVECGSDMRLGEPCYHCIDEHETAIAAGIINGKPKNGEREELPPNAGRYEAPTTVPPSSEELMTRIRDLHLLRNSKKF